jgi:NitT/TauT family transport system permease protein
MHTEGISTVSELDVEGVDSSIFGLDLRVPQNQGHFEVELPASRPAPAPSARRKTWGAWRLRLERISGVALLLVAWELAPRLGWVDRQFFVPPTGILRELLKTAISGEIFIHVGVSLGRTLAGLVGAILIGIPVGFLLAGWFPKAARFFQPLLKLFGQVNAFSLFPLFVLFFGIGEIAKFSIIFWSCVWPLLFGTIVAIRGVDPLIVKTARSMACSNSIFFRDVLWPAALPAILTAVRIGAMTSFLMLIAAEMVGADNGLGWLVHNGTINYQMARVYLAASTTAALGLGMQAILNALERRLVHWRPAPTSI